MLWADKLLEGVEGAQVINDSWTPSGIIHMGSLKGPVIHDTLYKILKQRKQEVKFIYGFDDADPIDGLPSDLTESHSKYLGVPISKSPSPDGNGSFGDFFSNKMKKLMDDLDIHPEIYKTSELYKSGKFNKAIKFVLDNAESIRKVYGEIYKKDIAKDWLAFQVVCPNCGKVGTSKVSAWNGKEVTYSCEENLVQWAKGCGEKGTISPFDGNGKMPWKVEWAAKWWIFGVTIEGAGKDHVSSGGSYDVAMKIYADVFNKLPPLKIAYEFFLSNGKKMSSSKGLGLMGEDLLSVVGPQRTRFLMIKTPPNQAVEFTPKDTDSIPKLFDDYQKTSTDENENAQRIFLFSQVDTKETIPEARFTTLSQWVQMPNMEETIKKEGLEEWAKFARIWVEKYAPEEERFTVQKQTPEAAKNLSEKQKEFLNKLSKELDKKWSAEDLQKNIFEWAKELELSSKDAFSAIYITLIGKTYGPKAGWFILSLDQEFVKKRFSHLSEGKNIPPESA